MNAKDRIVVALDLDDIGEVREVIQQLASHVGVFKVGKQLFTRYGPQVVEMIHKASGKVFLDLKYHDIPNTVAKASEVATELGVFMFNVHASGGYDMMARAREASQQKAQKLGIDPPIILAVTVLTSISQNVFEQELHYTGSIEEQVCHYALLAQKAGLSGVVASAKEVASLRQRLGEDFVVLTPGIRPAWASKDDQARIVSPKDALEMGVDYMVIGRPILQAEDRLDAADKIVKEIAND